MELMTYSRERKAWYLYDAASSVIHQLGMVIFIPVFLLNVANEKAYNGTPLDSCPADEAEAATMTCTRCMPGDGTKLFVNNVQQSSFARPKIDFFGFTLDPVSFVTFAVTASTFLQAILFVTLGTFADRGSGRKLGLFVASVVGQVTTGAFLFMTNLDTAYYWAGTLTILLNCAFGVAFVFYNAYLPILVDADPMLALVPDEQERAKLRDHAQNRMSSMGFVAGYGACLCLAAICIGIQVIFDNTASNKFLADRISIFMHALWWFVLALPAWKFIQKRPGPPLLGGFMENALAGWKDLYRTVKDAKKYPNTFRFLLVYFFYSDTITTISIMGTLFAQEELCMDSLEMAQVILIILVAAVLGNLAYLRIYKMFELETKTVIRSVLVVYVFICFYGSLGIFNSKIGMRNKWELYLFGILHGLHTGTLQSFSRTLFADLIVPGKEGQFFALYQITDKGSSWMGPLVIMILQSVTGTLRYGFLFLGVITALSVVGIHFYVDHKQGMIEVGRSQTTSQQPDKQLQEISAAAEKPYDRVNSAASSLED